MQVVQSIEDLRTARDHLQGRVGVVPTMGALHDGHMALVRQARQTTDAVLATIFVNPKQFGEGEDFTAYPRDLDSDLAKLQAAGVDVVFTPTPDLMYPPGYQTTVTIGEIATGLEGDHRPGHFMGVATVVTKLFNLTQPDVAFFGQKDAQQVTVIRRLAADLNFCVQIAVEPTLREPDGLALSSRNRYLTSVQREAAPVLYRSLRAAGAAYADGERRPDRLRAMMLDVLHSEPLAQVGYVSVADAATLREQHEPTDTPLLASMAVTIGRARLLDNCLLPETLNDRAGLAASLGMV